MRKIVLAALFVACATLAIAPGGLAAKPGNSQNAKLCKKDGWTTWVQADRTAFANEKECMSYVGAGGTLMKSATQLLCESYGGSYVGPGSSFAWECNGWPVSNSEEFDTKRYALIDLCASNLDVSAAVPGTVSVQCWRLS
jgi:hypothetical protein